MRTASILPALVVVLGFVSEAGAYVIEDVIQDDRSIEIGGQRFGFIDWIPYYSGQKPHIPPVPNYTKVYLGPCGSHQVPFTATQGLVGFCLIVVGFIALVATLTVRWKRKQPHRL